MTANEFCSLQHCRNYGCSKLDRDKDLCTRVKPPRKPSTIRRGTDCDIQTARWSVKDCRAKKCPELRKDTRGPYPEEGQERCQMFGEDHSIMPGTLTHCIQDLDNMQPKDFFRHIPLPAILGEKEEAGSWHPRKSPGIKNCPDLCPYKLIEEVAGSGKRKIKRGTCAFCGETLGGGCGVCHTTILDAVPEDQQHQIAIITVAIRRMEKYPPSAEQCCRTCCPDGIHRCKKGDTACLLIKVPFTDLKVCPLWRIPAKLLPAPVAQIPEKPEKSKDSGQKEKTSSRKSSQKEKPTEPEDPPLQDTRRSGRWFICRVCEHDEIAQNLCKLETLIPPVGCTAISQEGDQPPDAPMAAWEPWNGKAEPRREPKKKPAVTGGNATLFDFDPIDGDTHVPCSGPEVGACKDCDEPECQDKPKKTRKAKPKPTAEPADPPVKRIRPPCSEQKQCTEEDRKKCEKLGTDRYVTCHFIEEKAHPSPDDPRDNIHTTSKTCQECEKFGSCLRHDPYAGCLDAVKAIIKAREERDSGEQGRHPAGPGGPQTGTCGTCGHHKGRKTFHESCPRLGELLFKGGTKSAKVLMEETARDPCEHWISKAERIPNITWCSTIRNCPALSWEDGICTKTGKKLTDQNYCPTQHLIEEKPAIKPAKERKKQACVVQDEEKPRSKPKKDTPEWFAALTEAKRKNNPHWLWEVWKNDPAKGQWLYEGTQTHDEAISLKERIEETRPAGSKVTFYIEKRPDPDYDPDDVVGPCKNCKIECLDDNNGCQEYEEHSAKMDGEPVEDTEGWPVCIISCGKAKIWDNHGKKKPKARVYAQDAYTGPLFTSAKNYAEQRHPGPWYILSDKYGRGDRELRCIARRHQGRSGIFRNGPSAGAIGPGTYEGEEDHPHSREDSPEHHRADFPGSGNREPGPGPHPGRADEGP